MARITITTIENLTVNIITEFSFDGNDISFDPTKSSGWDLNGVVGVEKAQYSVCGGRARNISADQADVVYSLGSCDSAQNRRVQVEYGTYKFDSLDALCLEDDDDLEDDFAMSPRDLAAAKVAIG